jgi:hypothetical protein
LKDEYSLHQVPGKIPDGQNQHTMQDSGLGKASGESLILFYFILDLFFHLFHTE